MVKEVNSIDASELVKKQIKMLRSMILMTKFLALLALLLLLLLIPFKIRELMLVIYFKKTDYVKIKENESKYFTTPDYNNLQMIFTSCKDKK